MLSGDIIAETRINDEPMPCLRVEETELCPIPPDESINMNSNWQEFLGASAARIENGVIRDFGDLDSELVAARDATVIAPLPHLAILSCTGEEAKPFLHNQLTSDLNQLIPDAIQLSSWCSAKGRMLASFYLYHGETGYWAMLSSDLLAGIQKRLNMYVLRSRVKIDHLSGHELIGLSGPQAENALLCAGLSVPREAFGAADSSGKTVIRLDSKRFIIVVTRDKAPELWKILSSKARPVGTPVWCWLDIQTGIPLITNATKEEFVPQMVNFDILGGVSFHKGCYPGQEVVARTKYLGKIKRHLHKIHSASIVSAGMSICSPENTEHPCGMVVNAAPAPGGGYDALAVIQESFVETGGLYLDAPGKPAFQLMGIST